MIAIFDLDKTITVHPTFTAWLMRFMRRHPWKLIGVPVVLVALVAYQFKLLSRKRLKEVMMKRTVAGLPAAEVAEVTAEFVRDWIPARCRPGALAALEAHRKAGDTIVMATASNDVHAIPLARALGIGQVVATRAELNPDGSMTGKILGTNCYGADKLDMVKAAVHPGVGEQSVSYSDHHTDWPLLTWTTKGVAVNATSKLLALAKAHGMEQRDWDKRAAT